jgi:hypothetical protein
MYKTKKEAQGIFLTLFSICSLCKWKFVVCPVVDDEKKNRSICFQMDLTDLPTYVNFFVPVTGDGRSFRVTVVAQWAGDGRSSVFG